MLLFPIERRQQRSQYRSILIVSTVVLLYYYCCCCISIVDGRRYNTNNRDIEKLRIQSKPWYMKNISVLLGFHNRFHIPLSPISIAIIVGILFYTVYFYYSMQTYCIASHILIKDTSKESKQKLLSWKEKINTNQQLFHKYAYDYSECPSGGKLSNPNNSGYLGKFYLYDMAPQFNDLCFNISTPKRTCVGPIQTQFGYHLIYIHEQHISK